LIPPTDRRFDLRDAKMSEISGRLDYFKLLGDDGSGSAGTSTTVRE